MLMLRVVDDDEDDITGWRSVCSVPRISPVDPTSSIIPQSSQFSNPVIPHSLCYLGLSSHFAISLISVFLNILKEKIKKKKIISNWKI